MVHTKPNEREKIKPRGRPFAPGNKKGKPSGNVLGTERHSIGDKGGVLKTPEIKEEVKKNEPEKQAETIDKSLTLIESIVFKNGENTITIRLSKKHNRMFRVQAFLNDAIEIRPVTYTGSSPAFAFWNLLKGALKK